MSRLIFKAADVRRVVEHSIAALKQGPMTTYKNGRLIPKPVESPAVLFVHDQGVYLMSNGQPRDIIEGESSFVAQAKGCDPKKDAGWWETSRALVGGDDFGETLPWAIELKALLDAGAKEIVLELTENSVEIVTEVLAR